LHGSDKLVGSVVVDGLLFEEFIIEHLSSTQEESHPATIQNTTQQEDSKHHLIIYKEHHREHHEGKHGKGDVERLLRKEVVHTAMVIHSLHQVAHELGVEERHREFQELDEEITHQGDIDAHGDSEQAPSTGKVYRCSADGKH